MSEIPTCDCLSWTKLKYETQYKMKDDLIKHKTKFNKLKVEIQDGSDQIASVSITD